MTVQKQPRATVLVVDDLAANLKLAFLLLTHEGYDVRLATNATDALRELETSETDLILMDLQLPGVDGYALTRRLKADARLRHITVIAVTAYASMYDRTRALEAGCDGYLAKPLDPDTFGTTLDRWLSPERSKADPSAMS